MTLTLFLRGFVFILLCHKKPNSLRCIQDIEKLERERKKESQPDIYLPAHLQLEQGENEKERGYTTTQSYYY